MESIDELIKINDLEKTVNKICDFINDEIYNKFQKSGAIVGLSGGIDSAVTAALCVKALGSDKVYGLIMPEKESESTSRTHAQKFAQRFDIKTEIIDISGILSSFGVYEYKEKIVKKLFPRFNDKCRYRIVVPHKLSRIGIPFMEILDDNDILHKIKISSAEFLALTAATSVKHRVRMTLLYFHGEKNNQCVVGTTNKSEYLQGYFVKYGDGGSDIEPLVNLYKTQVYQLGRFLNIPEEILTKEASPDVWSFPVTDEEFFFSIPYDVVDLLLYAQENNLSVNDIKKFSNLSDENIENLLHTQRQKYLKSQHMREIPHMWIPNSK
jgi:NAD+ synthase